jgi:endonuclease/exonuclease/phosphatase family metal-dependent hydrolase
MTELTIASLNLRFGISPRVEQPYDVTAAIAALDADVVALQEVWRPKAGPAAHETAAAELGYTVTEVALPRAHNRTSPPLVQQLDGPDGTWWGVAVLTRQPVLDQRHVEFRPVPLDAAVRRALVTTLEPPWGGRLAIVTPHLTYRLWGSAGHLRALHRATAALVDPAVILGDFNMWGPVVGGLMPGWQRPVRGRTWPAHRPHSQIDHILVSPKLRVVDARVLGPVGSDHRPVRVAISA